MKKKSFVAASLTTLLLSIPLLAFAQEFTTVVQWLGAIQGLLTTLTLVLLALALVFFLWGLAKFILNAGDAEEQKKGKQIMFWGIIALFVMITIWGIVEFIGLQLGITADPNVTGPKPPK